jgi:CHASE2 domain-containing sensor protein
MLTGNLPWDGQVSLARRQKEAYAVLPDPRDVRPELPPPLVDVLRQMTAFSWIERPSTVGEAFELLVEAVTDVVGDYSLDSAKPVKMDETLLDEQDAQSLLQNFLARWDLERQEFPARLTHLAFIGEYIRQEEDRGQSVSVEVYRFMLRGALTHAYQLDYWWQSLGDAQDRLQVGLQALENEDEATIARVIDVMAANVSNLPVTPGLLLGIQDRLIDLAVANQNSDLGLNALKILEFNLPKATRWQPASAPGPVDEKLAHLALGDSDLSGRAARLIGQWRNRNAVQAMLDAKAGRTRVLGALEEVKKAAGSLPDNVPLNWKWRASTRSVRRQFKEDADRFSLPRLLIGVGMGALVSIWMALGIFSSADARMRDAMLAPYPVSSIVTIVEVNDATLERFGRLDSWPRTRHAELIDDLTRDGARAIVFDIIFASQTPEDDLLAQAMRRAGDVVQPVMGQGDAYQDVKWTFRFEGRLLPDPTLSAASAAIGHTNIVHDADGYVRRMPTTIIANGQRYPSLTLAALEVYLSLNTNPGDFPEPADGWLDFAGRRIPVGKNGEMLINFAGPPAQAQGSTYQRTSYQSVLDHSENPASIKDKIILIGITATAGPDVYLTPVSQGRPMTGIEILANTIETIWSSRFIQRPSLAIRILILIGLGALVGLVSKQPGSGLLLLVGVAGTYFILANVLFDSKGILLDLLYPFLAILTSFMGVMGYRFSILRKTQNK